MPSLSARDTAALLDAAAELGGVCELDELQRTAARLAFGLITVDRAGWVSIDRMGRRMRGVHWPRQIPHLLERVPDDIAEIPLVVPQLSSPGPISLRISDVLTRREWHRTRIWAELYGPEGAEHQIGSRIVLRPDMLHAMSFFRGDRDFSDHEVAVAEAFTRQVRVAAIRIGRDTADAAELGLTPRQLEALRSLETGDTVRRAAHGLGITEKTLENHLQQVYRRLGVTNRVAALRRLRRTTP